MGRERAVTLDEIKEQREKGWPDWHPEDYCHRCGRPNETWFVASPFWNAALIEQETPSGIVCPTCFVTAFEQQTGATMAWELRPDPLTMHHLPEPLREAERVWRIDYERTR